MIYSPASGSTRPVSYEFIGPTRRFKAGRPAFGRTLRIALAMRGGISLAVWIGGAVAELDLLRRIRLERVDGDVVATIIWPTTTDPDPAEPSADQRRARIYADLIGEAGYDRIVFDVLAGASAGGLNAVVFGVAQRLGTRAEALGAVWEDVGGVAELMHPPGKTPVDSLFMGDGYFWPELRRALVGFAESAERHEDLVADEVSIDLSATILDGSDPSDPDAIEGRGHFHFAANDSATGVRPRLWNRIPKRELVRRDGKRSLSPNVTEDLDRLAYAARTTSSFPGAFEPAQIDTGEGAEHHAKNMRHAFGAHRAPGESAMAQNYRVVDGGVFDNIPIDRAVNALRTRPSDDASQRALIYLDPSPATEEIARNRWDERLSRMLTTISTTVARLFRTEQARSEVPQVREFSAGLVRSANRLLTLTPLMPDAFDDPDDATSLARQRENAYVSARVTSDVQLLLDALGYPERWLLSSERAERGPFTAIPPEFGATLDQAFNERAALLTAADRAAILNGSQGVLESALCVYALLRSVDDLVVEFGIPELSVDLGGLRRKLVEIIRAATYERDGLLVEAMQVVKDQGATGVLTAWLKAPTKKAELRWAELESILRDTLGLVAPWGLLDGIDGTDGASGFAARWWLTPWSRLTNDARVRHLAPIFATTGVPPAATSILFETITSDEPAQLPEPLLAPFTELELRRRLRRAIRTEKLEDSAVQQGLAADRLLIRGDTKLSGAKVANFGGFLKRSWRTQDWLWGHLDAASGIVRFLRTAGHPGASASTALAAQGGSLPEAEGNETADLQKLIVEGTALEPAGRLDSLPGAYRLALASRGLRVLARALRRQFGTIGAAIEVLLLPWNWVRVMAPLAVDPPRAVLALMTVLAAVWTITFAGDGPDPANVVLNGFWWGTVAIVVVLLVIGVGRRAKRWKRLRKLLKNTAKPILSPEEADQRRRDTRAGFVLSVLAAPTLILVSAAAFLRHQTTAAWLCMVAAVVVTAIVVVTGGAVREKPHPRTRMHWRIAALVGAGGAVAACLASVLAPAVAEWPWLPLYAIAGAQVVVGLLAMIGWLRPWAVLLLGVVLPGILFGFVGLLAAVWPALIGWLLVGSVAIWGTLLWRLPLRFAALARKQVPDDYPARSPTR